MFESMLKAVYFALYCNLKYENNDICSYLAKKKKKEYKICYPFSFWKDIAVHQRILSKKSFLARADIVLE